MDLPFDRRTRRLVLGLIGLFAVRSWLRSWHQRWLATPAETLHPLPGDDVVPDANLVRTHAVSIGASPADVWPWLVQMGATRGGWYSYGRRGEGGVGRSDTILPDLNGLSVGDVVPGLRGGTGGFVVSVLDPERSLVLASSTDLLRRREARPDETPRWFWRTSWAFRLREPAPGQTRLVVRVRVAYGPAILAPVAYLVALPVHFLMQRRQLLGIKSRAEKLAVGGDEHERRH
jgi:hypothetical protein